MRRQRQRTAAVRSPRTDPRRTWLVRRPGPGGVVMTVLHAASLNAVEQAEPLSVDAAHERSRRAALVESEIGPVGLEIESHLVDFESVGESVPWDRVGSMLTVLDS